MDFCYTDNSIDTKSWNKGTPMSYHKTGKFRVELCCKFVGSHATGMLYKRELGVYPYVVYHMAGDDFVYDPKHNERFDFSEITAWIPA